MMNYKQKRIYIQKLTEYAEEIKNKPDRVKVTSLIQRAFFTIKQYDEEAFREATEKAMKWLLSVLRSEAKEREYWADRADRRARIIAIEEDLWKQVRFAK